MDPGLAILTGAGLATVGWIFNGRVVGASNRRMHTYQILARQEQDGKLIEAIRLLRIICADEETPNFEGAMNSKNADSLDYLLNTYEFVAAAIWCGDIDEDVMRRCERTRIVKLYRKVERYVERNRREGGQPSMWGNMQRLVGRWERTTAVKLHQNFYERIRMRPFPGIPELRDHLRWATKDAN
jgi:Domain of unknown function (DUF4760)